MGSRGLKKAKPKYLIMSFSFALKMTRFFGLDQKRTGILFTSLDSVLKMDSMLIRWLESAADSVLPG